MPCRMLFCDFWGNLRKYSALFGKKIESLLHHYAADSLSTPPLAGPENEPDRQAIAPQRLLHLHNIFDFVVSGTSGPICAAPTSRTQTNTNRSTRPVAPHTQPYDPRLYGPASAQPSDKTHAQTAQQYCAGRRNCGGVMRSRIDLPCPVSCLAKNVEMDPVITRKTH